LEKRLKVVFDEEALEDIENIRDYIGQFNIMSARRIVDEIFDVINNYLSRNPFGGASMEIRTGIKSNYRTFLATPNYIIIYEPEPTRINILRVAHAKQDWTRWNFGGV